MIQPSTNRYLRELSTIYVKHRRRCFKEGVCFESCLDYVTDLAEFISRVWSEMPDSPKHTRFRVSDDNLEGFDYDSLDPHYITPIAEAMFELRRTCKYATIDTTWFSGMFTSNGGTYNGGNIIKEWEAFRASLSSYNSSHSSSSTSTGRSKRSKNTRS